MPNEKQSKSKKKDTIETRVPKHVSIRLSYRDYEKLLGIADIVNKMKDDRDSKKTLTNILSGFDDDMNADKFLNLIGGLPAKERTLDRFYSQPPRGAPTKMFFTDPQKSNKNVLQLHDATKKWTKGKLRFDQAKETCPTDVRVMFYAYVRGKGLADDETRNTTVDKLLRKLAPKTLSGMDEFKRGDGSLIWKICSEIRGHVKDESDDEPPKRRGKKAPIVESSGDESSVESESEPEPPKRRSRK